MVLLFYTTYISVDFAHHEIFRAEVGKGGIKKKTQILWSKMAVDCILNQKMIFFNF